jgi:hypothetical protein
LSTCHSKPGSFTADCAAWSESRGEGSFTASFLKTKTDGIVLGPVPSHEFYLEYDFWSFTHTDASKFTKFRIGTLSSDAADNTMEWIDLTKDEMKKVRITGYKRTAYCESFTNCGGCIHGSKGGKGGRAMNSRINGG